MIFNPGGFDPVLFATKWQFAVLNNVTKVTGTHTLKGGFFFEHVTNNQPGSGNSNGHITLDTTLSQSSGNTFADLLLGRIGSYNEQTKNALHNIGYNRWEFFAQDTWRYRSGLTFDFGARFSYIGPWYDREGSGLVAWDPSRYPTDPSSPFPGFVWNAIDGGVSKAGVDSNFFIQPRVGVAWDLRGTGETVLRGGFGMFKSHDAQQPYADVIDLAAGVRAYNTPGGGTTLRALEGLGGGALIGSGNALDINDTKQPTTYSWSTTVNQKLPWGMMLELGYVGNKSTDLMNFDLANYNAVPLGAMLNDPEGDANRYRPFPNYGSFNVFRHSMYQNYHGGQLLVTRQRGSFGFTAAYTFSKTLGVRSGDPNGSRTGSEYILDPRQFNYGVLGTDRTHVASVAYNYQFGDVGQGVMNAVLGNWQVSGITQYISGAPLVGNFDIQGTLADGTAINATRITGSPDVRVQPALTCDPSDGHPGRVPLQSGVLRGAERGAERGVRVPDHPDAGLPEPRSVDREEHSDWRRRSAAADPRGGIQCLQSPAARAGHEPEPDAPVRQRPPDERRFRTLAGRQQGWTPDCPDCLALLVLDLVEGVPPAWRHVLLVVCVVCVGSESDCWVRPLPAPWTADRLRVTAIRSPPSITLSLFSNKVSSKRPSSPGATSSSSSPRNLAGLSNLAVVLARLGRFEEAIEEYERALKIEPKNATVRLNLAIARYKAAQFREAAKELARVRALQPGNLQATLLEADCQLAHGRRAGGDRAARADREGARRRTSRSPTCSAWRICARGRRISGRCGSIASCATASRLKRTC